MVTCKRAGVGGGGGASSVVTCKCGGRGKPAVWLPAKGGGGGSQQCGYLQKVWGGGGGRQQCGYLQKSIPLRQGFPWGSTCVSSACPRSPGMPGYRGRTYPSSSASLAPSLAHFIALQCKHRTTLTLTDSVTTWLLPALF